MTAKLIPHSSEFLSEVGISASIPYSDALLLSNMQGRWNVRATMNTISIILLRLPNSADSRYSLP